MKRIRPWPLIIFLSLMGFFILTIIVLQICLHEIDYKFTLCGIPVSFILLYMPLSIKIEYQEDFCYFFACQRKVKVNYRDIVKISSAGMPGGYLLQCYDDRKRNFFLFFPCERKKLRDFFDTIKSANPDVAIHIGWYSVITGNKLPREIEIKNALKFVLFCFAFFAVNYLMNFFTKKM